MASSLLTGNKIVRQIRTRNSWAAVGYFIFLLFAVLLLLAAGMFAFKEERLFIALACAVFGALLMLYAAKRFFSAVKAAFRPGAHRLFRKYGSPDDLAERILQGENESMMDHPQLMITERFLMKRKDFESFVLYECILLLYRKEHRTNGVLDGIYLVVHDCYGDSYEYPFRLSNKYAGDLEFAASEIAKRAPESRFGYTTENLKWVKENVRPLPGA